MGTLQDLDIEQVIIIGGTAAVSDAVRTSITGMGIITGRVGGANRYGTAAAWASFAGGGCSAVAIAGEFDCGLGWGVYGNVLLASGTNFADALSGGPLQGYVWDAMLMLTDPATLSPETAAWLTAYAPLPHQGDRARSRSGCLDCGDERRKRCHRLSTLEGRSLSDR